MMKSSVFRRVLAVAGVVAIAASVSSCTSSAAEAGPVATQASSLSVADAWVKSSTAASTAAFGLVTNTGGADVRVTGLSTSVSGQPELHETVENEAGQMVMQQIEGGFPIAAGDTLTLAPGGNHLMLLDLTGAVDAGSTIQITLEMEDGSVFDFDAPAKDYSGANESYEPEEMSGMDMSQ